MGDDMDIPFRVIIKANPLIDLFIDLVLVNLYLLLPALPEILLNHLKVFLLHLNYLHVYYLLLQLALH